MLCIVCIVYYVLYVLCYVMNWYVWVNIFTLLSSQRVLLGITCIACCTPCVAHIWISETQQIQHNTAWGSHSAPHSRQDQLIASACLCFGDTEYWANWVFGPKLPPTAHTVTICESRQVNAVLITQLCGV